MGRTELKDITIGQIIKERFEQSGMTKTEFARALNCDRANVYHIFRRKSIDIDLLIQISKILDYDFIREIYYRDTDPAYDHRRAEVVVTIVFDQRQFSEVITGFSLEELLEVKRIKEEITAYSIEKAK